MALVRVTKANVSQFIEAFNLEQYLSKGRVHAYTGNCPLYTGTNTGEAGLTPEHCNANCSVIEFCSDDCVKRYEDMCPALRLERIQAGRHPSIFIDDSVIDQQVEDI